MVGHFGQHDNDSERDRGDVMGDMLQQGLAYLTQALKASASQTVTYVRGTQSVDVQAVLGSKLLKIDDGFGGLRIQWTDMDFLIPGADLTFDGDPIIPHRGDLIYLPIGDQIQQFEVVPFGNEPPWRWSDPNQTMVRIHTKHFGSAGSVIGGE
jgi:hypothetical protein